MKNTPPDEVIRFEIDEMPNDNFNYERLDTREFTVKGVQWRIKVCDADSIIAGLRCLHNQTTAYSIEADFEFIVIHPDKSKNVTFLTSITFDPSNPWKGEVLMAARDYNGDHFIIDGKINIECRMWISEMKGIRIARQFDFTDTSEPCHNLVLIIEGEKIYVIKELLALHSPVFKAMFYGDFSEKDKQEIELKDVDRDEFIELLHMIYPSGKKITDGSVEFLLKLGDRFQIQCVIYCAEDFLIDSQKFSNAQKLGIADQYGLFALKEHCFSALKTTQDFKNIMESPIYENLSDAMKIAFLELRVQLDE